MRCNVNSFKHGLQGLINWQHIKINKPFLKLSVGNFDHYHYITVQYMCQTKLEMSVQCDTLIRYNCCVNVYCGVRSNQSLGTRLALKPFEFGNLIKALMGHCFVLVCFCFHTIETETNQEKIVVGFKNLFLSAINLQKWRWLMKHFYDRHSFVESENAFWATR